ncbi:MAG: M23 family metallopeptidase [Gloeobacteraceae cyanobacterium ES-bin-144]|nr:M23 family metallopeptidase [Verrucomicrobiales bacterium]
MLRSFLFALAFSQSLLAGIDLRLPTENQHLFTGQPELFYMYVERNFENQITRPWEAGSFGFVRSAVRVDDQVILTKFHEGIDICPMKRDAADNPLDLVCSIADGKVVHVSPLAGRSNYGKYVVVEHNWDNSAIYSLYAHLADITCKVGDAVKAGDVLGPLGFTGAGIDRTRAHVHLEITMMMSLRYDDWNKASANSLNYQGNFNGMNLTGADAARFFIEHKANPELRFSEYIASTPVYFKVAAPAKGTPDFVKRYPWICKGNPDGAASWEISFSATGMPVVFTPSNRKVDEAFVTAVRPSSIPHSYLTRNLITGKDNRATLTSGGKKLVALLMDDFPVLEKNPESAAP